MIKRQSCLVTRPVTSTLLTRFFITRIIVACRSKAINTRYRYVLQYVNVRLTEHCLSGRLISARRLII